MKRNLALLTEKEFDVLIVGGGIYGVCAAWDAALRGLSVALIEKNDFGSATSSNSLKIIHGGLRYLQHADFKRMRESITERRTLMQIAPHLVHPLQCVMPTYGHTLRGKEVMAVALFLNDLIGFDRNRDLDSQKHLPRGRVISKSECKQMIPGIDEEDLTGGALWYDCQVYNSERMLISILHSAVEAGATVANYVEFINFKIDGDQVKGVIARDNLSGDDLKISAKLVINNSGPWFNNVLNNLNGRCEKPKYHLSAAMNLVVKKQLFPEFAVGVWSKSEFRDEDAVVSKGSRLLFITPWRDYSLVGTTHVHYDGEPGNFRIREEDIRLFLNEINAAYPAANLKREDVSFFYGGLLPTDDEVENMDNVRLLKSYQIIDHQQEHGLSGLITVVSVKYTTARDVAEKTIDYALEKLGMTKRKSLTAKTSIWGGQFVNFNEFLTQMKKIVRDLPESTVEHLIYNYGAEYSQVMNYCEKNDNWRQPISAESDVLKAEVIYFIREEMAQKLSDVVRRRSELGSGGCPDDAALKTCADLMAAELGWDKDRIQKEIAATKAIYVAAS